MIPQTRWSTSANPPVTVAEMDIEALAAGILNGIHYVRLELERLELLSEEMCRRLDHEGA